MVRRLTDRSSDYTFGKRKGRWPLVIAGIVVAVLCIGTGSYLAFGRSHSATPAGSASTPTKVARLLDGVLVDPASANLPPVAVVVENHVAARPQSGLTQAGVVYEALAEGGITRFLAIFSTPDDVRVGPVRSARPYFVDLARAYNGLFVHAGYSPQGKDEIAKTKIADFDQFFHPSAFTRVAGRPAEHALYTSLQSLRTAGQSLIPEGTSRYVPWTFKDDAPSATPSAKPIAIEYSTASYRVRYTYDPTTNHYLRSQGGVASVDSDGSPIAPKNVIVLFTTSKLFDPLRRDIAVTGEGKALVFLDGQSQTGTWAKSAPENSLLFHDASNQTLALNRGQTWVEVVDIPEKNVSY